MAAFVAAAVKREFLVTLSASSRSDPDVQHAADADRCAVSLSCDRGIACAVLASESIHTVIVVTVAFDPRDAEARAAIALSTVEAAAVAPHRVLMIVVRPGDGPVIAALCSTQMRGHVERHTCDDRSRCAASWRRAGSAGGGGAGAGGGVLGGGLPAAGGSPASEFPPEPPHAAASSAARNSEVTRACRDHVFAIA